MKKHQLFCLNDSQERKLNQVKSLADVLCIAGGLNSQTSDDLCNCLGLISDLASQAANNQAAISKACIDLSIVNQAVIGN